MTHNFESPSEILDKYIEKFESKSTSGNKQRSTKTKKSSKERSKNVHIYSCSKPKQSDLDYLLTQPQIVPAQPTNLRNSLTNFPTQTENSVEQVEKLIENLRFRMNAYKNEITPPKDNSAFKTSIDDLNDFKCRSKSLIDSLNSFKDVFSSTNSNTNLKQSVFTDSESSIQQTQPPLLFKQTFKPKYALSEDPIPQEVSESEYDSSREEKVVVEDPLEKCINKFQDLNKKLAITKQLDTCSDLKLFDTSSLLMPTVNIDEPKTCVQQVNNYSSPSKSPILKPSMNTNPDCFVYSTNRCVQNFINECIKITNEIPILNTKINPVK